MADVKDILARLSANAADFDHLIPEVAEWRAHNGDWFSADMWVGAAGSFPLAIGYSRIFWPDFTVVEDHVLRAGREADDLREWQEAGYDRRSTEAVMNHIHLADLHTAAEAPPTEAQLRYLGQVLKRIYEVKLAADFPDRRFVVSFRDEPGLEALQYELTFWQDA